MDYENNEDFLKDLMDQIYILHKENARLILKIEELEKHNEELNRKLKSIQALFL
jgi:radical SAM superfamily enzyme with C-terminal helix-hairpin-helix motif